MKIKNLIIVALISVMVFVIGLGAYRSLWNATEEEIDCFTTTATITDFNFENYGKFVGFRSEKINGTFEVSDEVFDSLSIGQEIEIKVRFTKHFNSIIHHEIQLLE